MCHELVRFVDCRGDALFITALSYGRFRVSIDDAEGSTFVAFRSKEELRKFLDTALQEVEKAHTGRQGCAPCSPREPRPGDRVRNRRTGAMLTVTDGSSWPAKYYEVIEPAPVVLYSEPSGGGYDQNEHTCPPPHAVATDNRIRADTVHAAERLRAHGIDATVITFDDEHGEEGR